jgi:hypothetical protein
MTTTTTFAVATPHALILTVSHGLLFQPIPLPAATRMLPSQFFAFQFTVCVRLGLRSSCAFSPRKSQRRAARGRSKRRFRHSPL